MDRSVLKQNDGIYSPNHRMAGVYVFALQTPITPSANHQLFWV